MMQPAAMHGPIGNLGTVAAGGGNLINGHGSGKTITPVVSPIALGDGNHRLIDNEVNAVITGGSGNNQITELGTGVSITLGNGNNTIMDNAGTATIVTGTGDQNIMLGGTGNKVTIGATNGGTHDVSSIQLGSGSGTLVTGDGNMIIGAGGANNTITVGNGNTFINLGGGGHGEHGGPGYDDDAIGNGGTIANCGTIASGGTVVTPGTVSIPVTSDVLHLGNGTNMVFLGGSGNTIYDGSGTDTIRATSAGNDTFVLNAAGGTQTIGGFSLTNGDKIDASKILAGVTIAADLSNIGTYVTLATVTDAHNSAWTDSVLTIKGAGGTDTLTLVNTGSITLADLTKSMVL